MQDLSEKFKSRFPEILINEPLKKYSTFQIGGPADYFYHLKDTALLASLIDFAKNHEIPFFILGAGSNILFDDSGFRGLIIKIESDHISFQENDDHYALVADAGALVSKLLQFSLDEGLTGLEKWIGLPGTVGGAVRGNAGCNGLETKDILINAVLFNPETSQITIQPVEYFDYDYRESRIKPGHPDYENQIVLSASFRVSKRQVSAEQQLAQINCIRQVRLKAQPPGLTTGSFFKNPLDYSQMASGLLSNFPKVGKLESRKVNQPPLPDTSTPPSHLPAGMLIDLAGLKGHTIGHAQISPKHGNFFMNLKGQATSKDMLALSQLAQSTVFEKFGIHLTPEVVIVPPSL